MFTLGGSGGVDWAVDGNSVNSVNTGIRAYRERPN